MGFFWSRNEFPVEGRTVLITGGSRGLGFSAACQLAAKGANVIVVARNSAKLTQSLVTISEKARSSSSQRFHCVAADVSTAESCGRVISEATAWNDGAPPDVVWCCSGSAHPSLFIDTPVSQIQTMMDSNCFPSAYMAHTVLNAWLRPPPSSPNSSSEAQPRTGDVHKRQKRPDARHLIFSGSFVSFYSFAGNSAYSPSKAAVRALSDSLSQEMNLYAGAHPSEPRVRIHTVFPATMPTQGLDEENLVKTDLTKLLEEGDQVITPDECARRAIAGLERGEELIATNTIIRLVMTSAMSGAIRGGWLKGFVDTLLG